MHGGSGIILEALKLKEINIFQIFQKKFLLQLFDPCINNTAKKKKIYFLPEIKIFAV